ncbi:uncharacterized protein LOC124156392 [Ischnura elegans]|uniref:uncharacterized protein LOC124156392 n=1 Tax=Ischnura elegans TaxID=197161 RepID=UPI001ED87CF4|nr:uncharacterized protein LOC124156392 [Ischnura elegans]
MSAATASSILRTRLQQHSGPPRPHSAAGGLPSGDRGQHGGGPAQHHHSPHQQHHHSMPSTTTTTTAASLLSERALCPPTFPSTFRDFFSELCSEEVVFLEEKLIPRKGAAPEDGNHSTDTSATEEETESRPRSLMRSSLRAGRKGSVRLGRRRRASLGGGVGEGGGGGGGSDTLSLPFGCALKERCSSARSSLGGPDRCFRAPSPLPSLQRLDAVEGKEEEEEEEEDYDEEDEEAGRRWAGARVASRGAYSEEADLPPPSVMAGRRRSSSIPAPLPARVQTRTANALLNPGAVNELQTAFADWPGRRRLSPGAVVIGGGSFKARSSRADTPRHGSQGEHMQHHGGSTEANFRPRTSSMPAVTRQRPMLGRCRRRGVLGPGFSVASGGGSGGCPGGSDEAGGGEYYRLRSFSITSKGVINCGDSFRSRRRSRSINSVSSVASSQSGGGGGGGGRGDVAGGSGRDRIPRRDPGIVGEVGCLRDFPDEDRSEGGGEGLLSHQASEEVGLREVRGVNDEKSGGMSSYRDGRGPAFSDLRGQGSCDIRVCHIADGRVQGEGMERGVEIY